MFNSLVLQFPAFVEKTALSKSFKRLLVARTHAIRPPCSMSNSESRADCSPVQPAVKYLDITRFPSESSDSSFAHANQSLNDIISEQIDDKGQISNRKPIDKAIVLHFAITIATILTIIALLFLTVGPGVFNSDPGSCNPTGNSDTCTSTIHVQQLGFSRSP
jgi:hypothetical protein